MAARKKKTTADTDYSKLDEYCIWLHEYYTSLRRAGFTESICLYLITAKDSFPDWVNFKSVDSLIKEHLEDEDE